MHDGGHDDDHGGLTLGAGLAAGRLTVRQLWWQYVAIGGSHSVTALYAYLDGRATWSEHQHNVAAQALNEHLMDRGMDHLVAYSFELRPPP